MVKRGRAGGGKFEEGNLEISAVCVGMTESQSQIDPEFILKVGGK